MHHDLESILVDRQIQVAIPVGELERQKQISFGVWKILRVVVGVVVGEFVQCSSTSGVHVVKDTRKV